MLASVPLHTFFILPLPNSTCAAIESHMRNFLWSTSSSKEKTNFVSWRMGCLPFLEGTLGIRRICEVIKAYAIRLGWCAICGTSLCAAWFRSKYLKRGLFLPLQSLHGGSCILKHIRSIGYFIAENTRWVIDNGHTVNLWYDF